MSHEQSTEAPPDTPITYGDVFNIQGDLAKKPIAPRDASLMQVLEIAILGGTPKGGVAARLQAAAAWNEMAGLVGPDDMNYVSSNLGGLDMTDSPRSTSSESSSSCSDAPTIFETMVRAKELEQSFGGEESVEEEPITIGEALEVAALTAGKKPVEWSDAAAIEAAEVRATGQTTIAPDGIAAAAQSAATRNAKATSDVEKTKLADVLTDASTKLASDKAATRSDAEGVLGAEMRNNPRPTIHPEGVSAAVAAAARLNDDDKM